MPVLLGLLVLLAAATAHAQSLPAAPAAARADGPPAPALPDTIARDGEGRATVIAVRVPTPMRIDGVLDEAIYTTARPASGFIQNGE